MASDSTSTGDAGTLKITVTQSSQSISGNYSNVAWSLTLSSTYSGTYRNQGVSWSTNIGGTNYSGTFTFNFATYSTKTIASGTTKIYHNSNGTKSITATGDIGNTFTSSIGGPASVSVGLTLSTIPRASVPTVSPSPCDAGATLTIATHRASTSFTHTATYAFGTATGTIATKTTAADIAWVIPMSLLDEIPNDLTGTGTITLTTYDGTTSLGSKSVSFSVSVPTSVVPTFGTITNSEATTSPNVATIVGAYVKDKTTLNVAITSESPAYSSPITARKIEVAGQTINAASGVTAPIAQSGTLALVGTVTDSRGRSSSETVNISVLNYAAPAITSSSAARVTAGGVPDANGVYFKVNVVAVTQSLIVGTQRNSLSYVIRIKATNDATPWASVTPIKSGTATGTGYNEDSILGTFSVSSSYTVRIEITDSLAGLAVKEMSVSTGGTQVHFSGSTDAVGFGKYVTIPTASIDAVGQIYQNDGKQVLDIVQGDARYDARYDKKTDSLAASRLTGTIDPALMQDTGWINIPLRSGFKASTVNSTPQICRIGSIVYMRGLVYRTSGSFTAQTWTIGDIPTGYGFELPTAGGWRYLPLAANSGIDGYLIVMDTGDIRFDIYGTASWLSLSTSPYPNH